MTTAALHREMVEALRRVVDMLDGAENPFSAGSGHWYRWMERRVRELGAARAALGAFAQRAPLRDQQKLRLAVFTLLAQHDAAAREERTFTGPIQLRQDTTDRILDALEPLLYGERD